MENGHSSDMSKEDYQILTPADLLEMKNKVDDELRGLLIARSAVSQESSPGDCEELQGRIRELEEKLLESSNKCSVNELLLKRIQTGKALSDIVFNETEGQENNVFVKRSLEELELVSHVKRIHKEVFELQEKLDSQRLDNARLRKENLEMMQKLNSRAEKSQEVSTEVAQNREYKKLKSELDVKCKSLEIHKNLIQHLIAGRGDDWSQNPELSQLMLQCEEPLNL